MSKLAEIERAVSALPPEELTAFRDWFDRFEANRFDARLEADMASGRLDDLAAEALDDVERGRARPV